MVFLLFNTSTFNCPSLWFPRHWPCNPRQFLPISLKENFTIFCIKIICCWCWIFLSSKFLDFLIFQIGVGNWRGVSKCNWFEGNHVQLSYCLLFPGSELLGVPQAQWLCLVVYSPLMPNISTGFLLTTLNLNYFPSI